MKIKDGILAKILISVFISILLVLTCFYRYNKEINEDFIEKSEKEAFTYSYINSQLFESRIKNSVSKLDVIRSAYFSEINDINEDIKQEFYNCTKISKDSFAIYTKEELESICNGDNQVSKEDDIKYIYDITSDNKRLEIILPIYNNDVVIGAISNYINEDEFNNLFKNGEGYKFSTYIFDHSGNILFGEDLFGIKNIKDASSSIEIKDNLSYKEDLYEKIKNKKSFEINFSKDNKQYYAFFYPTEEFYTAEIMSFEYVQTYLKDNSRILMVVLTQVMTIIVLLVVYLFGIILNQNKKLINTEIKRNRELDGIINSVPGGVVKILLDDKLSILFANEGFYQLTGYNKDEYVNKFEDSYIKIIDNQDVKYVLKAIEEAKNIKEKIKIEYKITKKDNTKCSISLTGEYLENINDIPVYQCIAMDMTEYRKILSDLELEKEQYAIISEMSDEIIFEYYIKEDEFKVSYKYKETFDLDFSKDNFIKNILKSDIIHKDDLKELINSIKSIKRNETFLGGQIRIKNNSGTYNWALYQGFIINDLDGNVYKIVGKIANIDKFKKEIEELREKSNRDPLTKLYNKTTIETIVNKSINKYNKNQHALFIIDIDNFKLVNDTFGHIFGDAVLKNIANSITNICREQDSLARIGGDEFVLFLENIKSLEEIEVIAKNLCNIFRKVYNIENREYRISGSIGISLYSKDGTSYNELLEKADIAVYNAKNEGKDQYKLYEENMKHISLLKIQEDCDKENAIRNSKRKSVYENVLIDISEMFLQVKDMKATINLILATLCKTYNISRSYVFEVSNDGKFVSNTYEWYDTGLEPLKRKKQNIPFDEKEYLKAYGDEPFLYYENIEEIDKNQYIKEYIYERDKIKLYFSCYFMEQGKVKGFVGFESYDTGYNWVNEEIEGAFFVARLIGTQILKDKTDRKFSTESEINHAIVDNQQLYTYIIKEDTFELLYFNEKVNKIMHNPELNKICYKLKGYDKPCHYCPIRSSIEHLDNNSTKYFCELSDIWLGATCSKLKWIDGQNAYIVCARDISEYIEQINYTDSLTGIPSITKFKIKANNILNNLKSSKQKYALLYMDIDKFKYINDTFGYVRGDDVLKTFAMLLYENIREGEIFCRFNDDRFLSIIKYDTDEELEKRIISGSEKTKKMQKFFFSDIKLSVICGIYKISEYDKDLNAIIDKANIARKTIKGSHKNTFAIYTSEMNEAIIKEKLIEGRMSYALKNNEFLPYLQPKFDLNTNKVCGAEALVRWQQKNGEMIYPNDFIPIFEKNGFIVNLDLYIYEQIFIKIQQWLNEGINVMPISLNVSRAHTISLDFIKTVLKLVNKYNIPLNLVEFELTENIFSDDLNHLNEFIQALRNSGFKISIDDFGSAYSSLNLLKEIDVDIIKLDKGFLDSTTDDKDKPKDKVIIECIINMAKNLNLEVVCEGIETLEQISLLKDLGCEIGQGYVFSRPIPIEEFEEKFLGL